MAWERFSTPILSKMWVMWFAHGFLGEPEMGGYLGVVESLGNARENLGLAGGELGKLAGLARRRCARYEGVELLEELFEGRVVEQQRVIRRFQGHEARTRDHARQHPAFLERSTQLAARMQNQRGAGVRAGRPR